MTARSLFWFVAVLALLTVAALQSPALVIIQNPIDHHPIYWLTACLIFGLSVGAAPYLYDRLGLSGARSRLFQYLLELDPRPLVPRYVKVVIIDDEEFWKGYPSGRRPIKRDYLATIIDKVAECHARVIAIDFDVRLPNPESEVSEIPEDYQIETDKLIASICKAAERQQIVLSRTIWAGVHGYRLEPDIYQPYGICTQPDSDARWENPGTKTTRIPIGVANNITCGYIALPYDPLLIPGRLNLSDGNAIDSFALAVTKAVNPRLVEEFVRRKGGRETYGNYISPAKFKEYDAIIPSAVLLSATKEELYSKLNAQVVIVGGDWSSLANKRGRGVDMHSTPIGDLPGAFVHASYIEALLDSRSFRGAPPWVPTIAEILFGLIAALIFAAAGNLFTLLVALMTVSLILILFEWFALHQLGMFFDALIPLAALWLHSVYDRLLA